MKIHHPATLCSQSLLLEVFRYFYSVLGHIVGDTDNEGWSNTTKGKLYNAFFLFRYLICFRILYKWTDDVILQHQGKISTTFFTFFIRKILVKYLWTTTADPYREIHDIYKIYVALRSCSLSAGNLCSDTNGSWFESDRLVCAEVRSLQ